MKSKRKIATALSSMALLAMLGFPSAAQAPSDVRIALIIGNAAQHGLWRD
ncbi:MAG: hypothetical protein QM533_06305 [Cytophagales bacterium]|nr:hypothetical protein [Cytophagales bacterium]